ncbi:MULTISPECIES: hypothetical protein [unclassified Synechococcus]|uniref:hypothetical protein n=1 Tax=unclassified Synechococcus TaxID=2626047 RepID=UPI0021A45103|nr:MULTISPECIES: hypothetical protein [unclassified Synechococcus]MCT0214075.1 hypothetical protein [Synechococcus sp. CS-1326]MCT0234162.1 hypothetical protein [Synechococcus sp. CS-1327]
MPNYRITAEGLEDLQVACSGCSGDALALALTDRGMERYTADRRSEDGLQWWFQVTFSPEGASEDRAVTKEVRVDRIDA